MVLDRTQLSVDDGTMTKSSVEISTSHRLSQTSSSSSSVLLLLLFPLTMSSFIIFQLILLPTQLLLLTQHLQQ